MNFLFHLHLAGDDPELLAGGLAGDFVKGPLDDRFPPGIARGIRLHRTIDSFAAQNSHFRHSRLALAPSFGHYRGVLVDLFYDHFLAREWDRYGTGPLAEYVAATGESVRHCEAFLPAELVRLLPIIFGELLPSYVERDGIGRALARMARRVKRENPLAAGIVELDRCYDLLGGDFRAFLPEAELHARRFRGEAG
jgi:acyl carrier protein phosphodiesterase